MATAKLKRAPAWSRPEVLDLIGLWGEESVLAQLRASKRNLDIYGKISQGMLEKGHNRDAQQCRVKIKELHQSYQKVSEANSRSGSSPQKCRFYEELHAILGGDPTTVPPRSIDTSARSQSTDNDEDSVDKEEEEAEESRVQESGVSILPESQDLFLTPEQSSSTQDSTNNPGEDRLTRDQADMLRRLVELQEERRWDRVPLQPLHNAPQPRALPPSPSPATKRSRSRMARLQ
ncbi:zinc finger and SCAN domain-containing protein 29-like [Emydura macquarii macquarii]|uniref:zinc finger and SCAN domain-containing protein 29-like n=1 Tax=Emydura macquarii macquarii TaxID=1129001 RepID=UPI00352B3FDC